jgi:pyruvate formate lyase activating enzyme
MSAESVVEEVLRDEAFYRKSGGGVTVGGGEPLAQTDFAAAILNKCMEKGLRTAVESAGHVPWSQMEKVLPFTDLFLYDVKHMNPEKHRDNIGTDNHLILANLRRLVERRKRVVACVPLIPGFNDTPAEVGTIARFAASLGIGNINLLPYHRFGEGKYPLLGRPYQFQGRKGLSQREIRELKKVAATSCLEVTVGG